MREIARLAEALRLLDANPEFTMAFYERPSNHYRVVMGMLIEQISLTARTRDMQDSEAQSLMNKATSRLMSEFWDKTWPNHDVHFHKSFKEYCNCPFTCLTEICDCVEKISKGESQ
jgi:hypothetical protein